LEKIIVAARVCHVEVRLSRFGRRWDTVGETLIGTSTLVPVTSEPALTCMYSTPQSR